MADDVAVGINVSKAELTVAVQPSGDQWTTDGSPAACEALVERLSRLAPRVVVIEATGGYERAVVAAAAAAGLPVAVVNPRQVRAFAQALGARPRRMRSMQLYSRSSGRGSSWRCGSSPMLRRRSWRPWWPDGASSSRCCTLSGSGWTTPPRPRSAATCASTCAGSSGAWLTSTTTSAAPSNAVRVARHGILRSVPGVGSIVARTLLADLPELGVLNRAPSPLWSASPVQSR